MKTFIMYQTLVLLSQIESETFQSISQNLFEKKLENGIIYFFDFRVIFIIFIGSFCAIVCFLSAELEGQPKPSRRNARQRNKIF